MALIEKLRALGDAIRAKTGKTDALTLDQMKSEIENIATGEGEIPRPYFDSSKITILRYFCQGGANVELFSDPNFDTSNVTDFTYCFDRCPIEKLPQNIDISSATTTAAMFYKCNSTDISNYGKDLSGIVLDMTNVTIASSMMEIVMFGKMPTLKNYQNLQNLYRFCYQSPRLKEVLLPDTKKVTTFEEAFKGCSSLAKIVIDMRSTTSYYGVFSGVSKLTDLSIGKIKIIDNNFRLDGCPLLTVESLVGVLESLENNAGDETGPYTVYFGSTNLAKLTDEQKLIAAEKNITLA